MKNPHTGLLYYTVLYGETYQADKTTSLLMGSVVDGRKQLIIKESKNFTYSS